MIDEYRDAGHMCLAVLDVSSVDYSDDIKADLDAGRVSRSPRLHDQTAVMCQQGSGRSLTTRSPGSSGAGAQLRAGQVHSLRLPPPSTCTYAWAIHNLAGWWNPQ